MKKDEEVSLVSALKDFFGFLEGQTVGTFMQEVKQLTTDDRFYYRTLLEGVGYKIKE